jgi:hypothetical protein
MSLYDELRDWRRHLDEVPVIPERLECGPRVYYALRRDYLHDPNQHFDIEKPVSTRPPALPPSALQVRLVVVPEMQETAWRLYDVNDKLIEQGVYS